MKKILALSMALSLWLLAACNTPQPTGTPPKPVPTAPATPTPLVAATPAPKTLTVWLPDWMLLEDSEAAQITQNTIQGFGIDNGIDIHLVIKTPRGPAGLLDALSKTYPVAPAVLPDLIVLPLDDAERAARQNLLQPLNELTPPDLSGDLYPFANNVLAGNENWYILPFAADFEHLAFQPSALSDIPLNWQIILESQAHYAFPAGGPEDALSDALLAQYLSVSPDGTLTPDAAALRELLVFYDQAARDGLLTPEILQYASPADTWSLALQGKVELAHTWASLWLRDRAQATILRYGPVPTADSKPRTIAHGWAFAVVTADPTRQALVKDLIATLMAPDTLASWTLAARLLPTRRSALALWPDDEYTTFTAESLERAIPATAYEVDPAFARSLHQAISNVLNGTATVDEAVQSASSSLQP